MDDRLKIICDNEISRLLDKSNEGGLEVNDFKSLETLVRIQKIIDSKPEYVDVSYTEEDLIKMLGGN